MQVNLDLSLKKILTNALIVGNLFAIIAAGDYVYWRYKANNTFAIMEFDLNSRMSEIQSKYESLVAQAKSKQAQQQAAVTTTTSTLPKK